MLRGSHIQRGEIGAGVTFVRFAGFVEEHAVSIRTVLASEVRGAVFCCSELGAEGSVLVSGAVDCGDAFFCVFFSFEGDVDADGVGVGGVFGFADDDFDDFAVLAEVVLFAEGL